MKINILIDRFYPRDYSIERRIFGKKYNLISLKGQKLTKNFKHLHKINGVLAWHENNFDKKIINNLRSCKIITRVGVGYNNVDLNSAKLKNIIVCNVPDYGINDVADHTITLILMLLKKINFFSENIRKKNLWEWGDHKKLKRIQNITLGILGCGRIGTAVAIRAKSFGMKVIFYDPFISNGYEKTLSISREKSLNIFLSKLDVLTIHTPLTEITKNMVNAKFLKHLKKGSILINTARGGIINKNDLYKSLKSGKISAVGLDVYENEPFLPNDQIFLSWKKGLKNFRDNIIFTPHNAFFNFQSYVELREKAALNLKNFFEKKIIDNQVN